MLAKSRHKTCFGNTRKGVSNHLIENQNLKTYSNEETTDLMLVRVKQLIRLGYNEITVVSVDGNVVVAVLEAFWDIYRIIE